jgi:hypothetical protein
VHISSHPQLQAHIEVERAKFAPLRAERTAESALPEQLSPAQLFSHRQYYAQAQDDLNSIRFCADFPALT